MGSRSSRCRGNRVHPAPQRQTWVTVVDEPQWIPVVERPPAPPPCFFAPLDCQMLATHVLAHITRARKWVTHCPALYAGGCAHPHRFGDAVLTVDGQLPPSLRAPDAGPVFSSMLVLDGALQPDPAPGRQLFRNLTTLGLTWKCEPDTLRALWEMQPGLHTLWFRYSPDENLAQHTEEPDTLTPATDAMHELARLVLDS